METKFWFICIVPLNQSINMNIRTKYLAIRLFCSKTQVFILKYKLVACSLVGVRTDSGWRLAEWLNIVVKELQFRSNIWSSRFQVKKVVSYSLIYICTRGKENFKTQPSSWDKPYPAWHFGRVRNITQSKTISSSSEEEEPQSLINTSKKQKL